MIKKILENLLKSSGIQARFTDYHIDQALSKIQDHYRGKILRKEETDDIILKYPLGFISQAIHKAQEEKLKEENETMEIYKHKDKEYYVPEYEGFPCCENVKTTSFCGNNQCYNCLFMNMTQNIKALSEYIRGVKE